MNAYTSLARWYDRLTWDVPYAEFCALYERIFKERGQIGTVLDIACGTGAVTALLAGMGYEMIAADASEDMLIRAQEKLQDGNYRFRPMLLRQGMEELDLYGTVDAAVCALDAVNYVDRPALEEALRRLHLFIRPGGVFIFDILSPDRLRALGGSVSADEDDDIFCVWRSDAGENTVTHTVDIFERAGNAWRRESEEHTEYIHEPQELLSLLESSGFASSGIIPGAPMEHDGRIFIKAVNGEITDNG